jgi:outer membrane murein-binding lipoprotein Lpp
MKKTKMFITILVVAVLMLTGCSNVQTPNATNNFDMTKKEFRVDDTRKKAAEIPSQTDLNKDPSDSDNNKGVPDEIFFGKVKSITGNEVEIEMALFPDWNKDEDIKPGDKKKPGASQSKAEIRENPSGQEDYYAPDPDSSIFGEDGEINLTYTGESKALIIPAGADIRNILGGKASLQEIKKGSALMIKLKVIKGEGVAIDMLTILK